MATSTETRAASLGALRAPDHRRNAAHLSTVFAGTIDFVGAPSISPGSLCRIAANVEDSKLVVVAVHN
jgi:hypothetical protein